MAEDRVRPSPQRTLAFVLFLAVSLGGGIAIGLYSPPGAWYAGLRTPAFMPPDWFFVLVSTALSIPVGIAGWRVWDRGLGRPFWRWFMQTALSLAWPPLVFGAHRIGAGFAVLLLLLAAVLAFAAETWRPDRIAALLFLPYAAWVAYAGLLNGAVWWLN